MSSDAVRALESEARASVRGESSPPEAEGGAPPRGGRPSNERIAVVMLLVTETMYFTGLIGAYIVLRHGAQAAGAAGWPPVDQPRLPIAVTWANTMVLLLSAVTMMVAVRSMRRRIVDRALNALLVTSFLGSCFLLIQGSEWLRLLGHGLTLRSSMYGGTFYMLIGTHAVHVVVAVAWLLWVLLKTRTLGSGAGLATDDSVERVELCAMYWYYVSALWIALFALVYG